jgi:hypothetical protein
MGDIYATAAEAEMDRAQQLRAARIGIALAGYNRKGILWRVEHDGQVILERTRVPALDACRYLLAVGGDGQARHVLQGCAAVDRRHRFGRAPACPRRAAMGQPHQKKAASAWPPSG